MIDFQCFGEGEFVDENTFSLSFADEFLRVFKQNNIPVSDKLECVLSELEQILADAIENFRLRKLFLKLQEICASVDRPLVLMIDEMDSAANNQVFLDFLSQLRLYYIKRNKQPTFQSVILAGVYDIKNLKRKIRPEDEHKWNSPWNIATDFKVDMSFSAEEISKMLVEYADDYHLEMDVRQMADLIYNYTSGYPFLVSKICKLLDEELLGKDDFETRAKVWTKKGFHEVVKILLAEKNHLFESLSEKLERYPELNQMLRSLLFTGRNITFHIFEPSIQIAEMFGFVKNDNGTLMISNRIFETWLYNLYLSSATMHQEDIYAASLKDKNQFVVDGHLNVRLILEKFVLHFHDLYGDSKEAFVEEEGRKYFLLYLRPIINGGGNYYIEARTRELKRTDVIIDYNGEQYIIEMKIWHGNEYNNRGEKQLIEYLDAYHQNKGYMLSFNFNKNKKIGVQELVIGDKVLIEAVV